jgi:gliding motility-associated-like protein
MKPFAVRPLLVTALFCIQVFWIKAQTRLDPGDLAIIQVNANNSACSGTPVDRISFICFKDITAGTSIDITDNGWERLTAGRWGNSEGFVRATRSGNTIPAGTVITFEFPPVSSTTYRAILPDDTWSFSAQGSTNAANLNSGGDQFYFMQGGIWNQGTGTAGNFEHDATYTGGRILFGFNTKAQWFNDDSPQESKLHPDVANCFNMAPTGSATDFIAYNGPTTAATQLEWISRISNPANWQTASSCTNLPPIPSRFTIANSGIELKCTTCQGCDTIDEVLRLTLPTTGGPFILEYSDGLDTFQVAQAQNNDSISIRVGETTTFFIVSVTDANGCPIYSNFGRPTTVTVTPGVSIQPIVDPVVACTNGNAQATFALSALDGQIRGNTGLVVQWYRDQNLRDTIVDPDQFNSGATTVFAITTDGVCRSRAIPVMLQLANPPSLVVPAGDTLCGRTCTRLPLSFQGKAPFILGFIVNEGGNIQPDGLVANSNQDSLVFCPSRTGTASILFSSIIDGNGCPALIDEMVNIVSQESDTTILQRNLCQGEQLIVNGQVYDESRPRGLEFLSTAAGCDSIISVDLRFSPRPNGSLSGDTTICGGGAANLRFQLSGGTLFDLVITNGNDTIPFRNVSNGTVLPVILSKTATFTLLSVQRTGGGCIASTNSAATITISEPSAIVRLLAPVSCIGASDGRATIEVLTGKAPFRFAWSNNATTQSVNNLGVGTYQVVITDSVGCQAAPLNVVFDQPDSLRAQLTLSQYKGFNISCFGAQDGSIAVNMSKGKAPFVYTWSNGATAQKIDNLSAGTYQVIVTDSAGCRTSPANARLIQPDSLGFQFTLDTAVCPGQENQLRLMSITGAGGPFAYALDGNNFTAFNGPLTISKIASGNHTLRLRDGNACIAEKTVRVPNSSDLNLELGPSLSIFAGDSVLIRPQLNFSPVSVSWQPSSGFQTLDSAAIIARPTTTTVFQLTVRSANGCVLRDNLTVLVEKRLRIYAPNAFSPNGDNQNDYFTLYYAQEVEKINVLRIFDRWGNQVFAAENLSNTPESGWDGLINGEKASVGVYVFVAEALLRTGKTEIVRGSLTLLR